MKHLLFFVTLSIGLYSHAIAQNALLDDAKVLFGNSQFRKAQVAIDTVVIHKKTSKEPESWYVRGNVYREILLSPDPKLQDIRYDAGSIAFHSYRKTMELGDANNKGEYNEFYQPASENLKSLASPLMGVAEEFFTNKNYLKCMEYAEYVHEITPNNTHSYVIAAEAAIEGNYSERAKVYFKMLKEQNFEDAQLLADQIKMVYSLDVNYAQAERLLTEALAKYPKNDKLLIVGYQLYKNDRQGGKAAELLVELTKQFPNKDKYLYELADVYNNKKLGVKDTSTANSYYRKAIVINENQYESLLDLGYNYYLYAKFIDTIPTLLDISSDTMLTVEEKEMVLDSLHYQRYMVDSIARNAYHKAEGLINRAKNIDARDSTIRKVVPKIKSRLKIEAIQAKRITLEKENTK